MKIRIFYRSIVVFGYHYTHKGICKFAIETMYSKMGQVKFVESLCSISFTSSILESTLLQLKYQVNELTFLVNEC